MGLWVLAGAWSADNLTDGHVPAFMVGELGCTRRNARHLVDAGLWIEVDGDYQFHAWNEPGRQPTRAEVEEAREAERKRKADYRQRMREAPPDVGQASAEAWAGLGQIADDNEDSDPSKPHAQPPARMNGHMSQRDNPGTPNGTPAGVPVGVQAPRPDPTRPLRTNGSVVSHSPAVPSAPVDDEERLDKTQPDVAAVARHLGSDVTWARRVCTDVLSRGGTVGRPTTYVLEAIAREPQRYKPTNTPPSVADLCSHGLDGRTCPHCRSEGDR